MIKVYNNPTGPTEFPSSVEEYLYDALEGPRLETDYDSDSSYLNRGNYIELLKLITEKLCAANIISEQELLDTLGLTGTYRSTFFKTEQ